MNAETDFVARNDPFQGLVKLIADAALSTRRRRRESMASGQGRHHDRRRSDRAMPLPTIGENMSLRRTAVSVGQSGRHRHLYAQFSDLKVSARSACWWRWNRQATFRNCRLSAVLWRCILPRQTRSRVDAARRPCRCDRARKGRAGRQKRRRRASRANVVEKIVESGLKTYFKEVCLLDQQFIHETDKTVAQALKAAESKVGGPIKVVSFVRYALGEGIEKQEIRFRGWKSPLLQERTEAQRGQRARTVAAWPKRSMDV